MSESTISPLTLIPAVKDYLWGGRRLVEQYGKQTALERIAESWEISCHPDGPSLIAGGAYKGQILADVLGRNPEWVGQGRTGGDFPLLVKLIDARQDLSVQVHPGDEYAWRKEGQPGKNEMWYVIDAEPGARLILGLKQAVSRQELRRHIEGDTLMELVRQVPVKAGDCYRIPAGMVHAIGAGVLVAEIQQSSNITYRVYDYNRVDAWGNPRQLHVEKALDVIIPSLQAERSTPPVLADWPFFRAELLTVGSELVMDCGPEGFHGLLALDGDFSLAWSRGVVSLEKGHSLFVPAGMGRYAISGSGKLLYCTL